ncbi:diiron oxygenase [Aquabacterium humicola]|uniref:diiron oxygenase n=1 Tax=Aquabacterium humicola TaxID=3237377 RepID=UPI0025433DE9|nr:diiron oxygenase [Rubrivivax pictus]
MQTTSRVTSTVTSDSYAKVIANSKRVRWDIEDDVIRGRRFDLHKPFLPAGLSLAGELGFLSAADRRLFSQVQGRSYACIFGMVERFISAKMLEIGRGHGLGDQIALEALVRMTDEEIKHQALFRRLEHLMAEDMPGGYRPAAEPNAVAVAVLGKSSWAVLALTLHIELFTQAHYRASIAPESSICPLWRDVFMFHWKEESQHAVLDELEFLNEDARLTPAQRDVAVDELIELVGAVDQILQAQAAFDAEYFLEAASARFAAPQEAAIAATLLKAYRWQYIVSGVMQPRFQKVLFATMTPAQAARVNGALAPLLSAVPAEPSPIVAQG